ncbi:hypothetical protein HanPSC8_Chr15g0648031 [Helianthus annuus]|nr:hypothetical protein HanPSC8_Chr15g0648031 [Helianthus annuus]
MKMLPLTSMQPHLGFPLTYRSLNPPSPVAPSPLPLLRKPKAVVSVKKLTLNGIIVCQVALIRLIPMADPVQNDMSWFATILKSPKHLSHNMPTHLNRGYVAAVVSKIRLSRSLHKNQLSTEINHFTKKVWGCNCNF